MDDVNSIQAPSCPFRLPGNITVGYDRRFERMVFTMGRVVLVVDDDAGVLETVTSMLEELGCEVISAESGPQALEQLSRNDRIEILITDINMPEMDGHELAHRASGIRPQLQILQLSGRERRREGYPMIRKPFSVEDLANRMKQTTGTC